MLAALRILVDVAVFRLRRLEMANLVAAAALAVVLRIPLADAAIRLVAAALLNVLAYLTNDYWDRERDLATGRAPEKTRYLIEHERAAVGGGVALFAGLVALSLAHDPGMLVAVVVGTILCVWYTARLKRVPVLDVVSMMAWGAVMPAIAVPLDSRGGLLLLVQLGLFSAAFEIVQVLRDRDADALLGVRTTAVALGEARSRALLRVVLVACAAWGTAVLDRAAGVLLLGALAVPYTGDALPRYWTRLRLALGLAWLGILVTVAARGSLHGLLLDVPLR